MPDKDDNGLPILYIDMDETICDFCGHPSLALWDKTKRNPPEMYEEGFFDSLKPLPGAIYSMTKLINENEWDIHILTQPVAKSPVSYMEKANWICKHLPDLRDKIILTQNKGLLIGNVLVDDSIKWAQLFTGEFILFRRDILSEHMWRNVLRELKYIRKGIKK